jgi:hypothetical protein
MNIPSLFDIARTGKMLKHRFGAVSGFRVATEPVIIVERCEERAGSTLSTRLVDLASLRISREI